MEVKLFNSNKPKNIARCFCWFTESMPNPKPRLLNLNMDIHKCICMYSIITRSYIIYWYKHIHTRVYFLFKSNYSPCFPSKFPRSLQTCHEFITPRHCRSQHLCTSVTQSKIPHGLARKIPSSSPFLWVGYDWSMVVASSTVKKHVVFQGVPNPCTVIDTVRTKTWINLTRFDMFSSPSG